VQFSLCGGGEGGVVTRDSSRGVGSFQVGKFPRIIFEN